MKVNRKLIVRVLLTALLCLVVSFLLSLLRPSWPLLVQMECRQAAADIRAAVEESLGPLSDDHPVFVAPVEGQELCAAELEKAVLSHRGWTREPVEGAGRVELTCIVKEGAFLFHATLTPPPGGAKGKDFDITRTVPDYTSLLPPVIAVIIAFGLKEVRIALAVGIWLGAVLHGGLDWTLGLWTMLRHYLLETVLDQFSFTIIVFTLAMVGMVRVAARAGGSQGIADAISRIAASARTSKLATALLGTAIFFDDYSNTVVVGTTMRNLTDRFRVSREKLAYIVDSTTAPVAGIALISTWIGYEISLLQELSNGLDLGMAGYGMFLRVLPIRFYCYFALLLVFLTSILSRDFGPMAKAELRAAATGDLTAPGSKPMLSSFVPGVEMARFVRPNWTAAAVPVIVVVLGTFTGMLIDGAGSERAAAWAAEHGRLNLGFARLCFESANGAFVLLIASLAGSWTAVIMAVAKRADVPEGAGDAFGRRCPAWQLLLPLPLSAATAAVIAAIQQGSSLDGVWIWSPLYWIRLLFHDNHVFLLYLFLPLGLVVTAVLAWRIVRQNDGNLATYIPVTFVDASRAWLEGLRALLYAVTILIMAWAIRKVCDDLGTSAFIVAVMGELARPWMIPTMVFVIACVTSFCTGTSWGTMGILIPTLLPFSYYIGGIDILMLSMGAVLDGAIFGDHCSPVSDTTVLSSTFSSCDHMDHVKTQLPYSVFCAVIALSVGYLPLSLHIPLVAVYAAGLLVMVAVLLTLGRKIEMKSPS
jgi:Na+/H+ antiporter NhaC